MRLLRIIFIILPLSPLAGIANTPFYCQKVLLQEIDENREIYAEIPEYDHPMYRKDKGPNQDYEDLRLPLYDSDPYPPSKDETPEPDRQRGVNVFDLVNDEAEDPFISDI